MENRYTYPYYISYGIKIFDMPAFISPDRPFLPLPVAELRKGEQARCQSSKKIQLGYTRVIECLALALPRPSPLQQFFP